MTSDLESRVAALERENENLKREFELFKKRLISGLNNSTTEIDLGTLGSYLDGKHDNDSPNRSYTVRLV